MAGGRITGTNVRLELQGLYPLLAVESLQLGSKLAVCKVNYVWKGLRQALLSIL